MKESPPLADRRLVVNCLHASGKIIAQFNRADFHAALLGLADLIARLKADFIPPLFVGGHRKGSDTHRFVVVIVSARICAHVIDEREKVCSQAAFAKALNILGRVVEEFTPLVA